jgi:hypothetical protein
VPLRCSFGRLVVGGVQGRSGLLGAALEITVVRRCLSTSVGRSMTRRIDKRHNYGSTCMAFGKGGGKTDVMQAFVVGRDASLQLNIFLIQCPTVPHQPRSSLNAALPRRKIPPYLQGVIPMQTWTCAALCVAAFGLLCRHCIPSTPRNSTSIMIPTNRTHHRALDYGQVLVQKRGKRDCDGRTKQENG